MKEGGKEEVKKGRKEGLFLVMPSFHLLSGSVGREEKNDFLGVLGEEQGQGVKWYTRCH